MEGPDGVVASNPGLDAVAASNTRIVYRDSSVDACEPPPTVGILGILPAKSRDEDPEAIKRWMCYTEEKYVVPDEFKSYRGGFISIQPDGKTVFEIKRTVNADGVEQLRVALYMDVGTATPTRVLCDEFVTDARTASCLRMDTTSESLYASGSASDEHEEKVQYYRFVTLTGDIFEMAFPTERGYMREWNVEFHWPKVGRMKVEEMRQCDITTAAVHLDAFMAETEALHMLSTLATAASQETL
jgi:hypothetical protein